jgi:hypothetical protein
MTREIWEHRRISGQLLENAHHIATLELDSNCVCVAATRGLSARHAVERADASILYIDCDGKRTVLIEVSQETSLTALATESANVSIILREDEIRFVVEASGFTCRSVTKLTAYILHAFLGGNPRFLSMSVNEHFKSSVAPLVVPGTGDNRLGAQAYGPVNTFSSKEEVGSCLERIDSRHSIAGTTVALYSNRGVPVVVLELISPVEVFGNRR